MKVYKGIVKELIKENKTIATMESCTGGALASEITNHPGASQILKYSAVTYSNQYKIKMGVDPDIIASYSVYSEETAIEMAYNISKFANSSYGIGITGKINKSDPANMEGNDNRVFIAIYDSVNNIYYRYQIDVDPSLNRKDNKKLILSYIGYILSDILNIKKIDDHEHEYNDYLDSKDGLIRYHNCMKCGHVEFKRILKEDKKTLQKKYK